MCAVTWWSWNQADWNGQTQNGKCIIPFSETPQSGKIRDRAGQVEQGLLLESTEFLFKVLDICRNRTWCWVGEFYNLRTLEMQARGLGVQSQPRIHQESEANLNYVRSCLKTDRHTDGWITAQFMSWNRTLKMVEVTHILPQFKHPSFLVSTDGHVKQT